MYELLAGDDRSGVRLAAIESGRDLIVAIFGGQAPHVGSVAVAVPRPSLRDPAVTSATASVITLVGHKDDELAKPIAEFLARELGRVVVLSVGIHVDQATPDDIQAISGT
ncbi:MAG: hypothetical protein AB1774_11560, partial [Bacillota bacterium]